MDFYLIRKSKLPKRINQLWTMIEVFLKSLQYDCVYDTLNQCTKIFSILRKYRIMKTKLVGVLHHPPFTLELKHGKADAYIFFDQVFYDYALEINPHMADRYYINEWYPDQKWYDFVTRDIPETEYAFFADNGKTKRDHGIVEESCEMSGITCMSPGDERKNASGCMMKHYVMDLDDDIGMARRLMSAKAILIPVKAQPVRPMGPYGVTSFLDAMALKMPVICSDNCFFADFVRQYHLGGVYQTGNKDSLCEQMMKLHTDQEYYNFCKKNMENYSCCKTMENYGVILKNILNIVDNQS